MDQEQEVRSLAIGILKLTSSQYFATKGRELGKTLMRKYRAEKEKQQIDPLYLLKTLSDQKIVMFKERRLVLEAIHQQVPSQFRHKDLLQVASQANYRKLQSPDYFHQISKLIPSYPKNFFFCIEKDVPRTFPDGHPLLQDLRIVLKSYAIRNPSLLYCQGMNYLVAYMLSNEFNAQESFWFLVQLIESIVMPDFFKDLSTIIIASQIFGDTIGTVFPKFADLLAEVGLDCSMFLVSWYVCLFTRGFNPKVSQYLLEKIVLEAYQYPIGFILYRISVTIISTMLLDEVGFRYEGDFNQIKFSIEQSAHLMDLATLMRGQKTISCDFQNYRRLEKLYYTKRKKAGEEEIKQKLADKKLSLEECSEDKPVCLHRVEIEKRIGNVEEVLILKTNRPINQSIDHSYFSKKVERTSRIFTPQNPEDCIITRHLHICCLNTNRQMLMPEEQFRVQKSAYYPSICIADPAQAEDTCEVTSSFYNIEDRFSKLSSFFIVDNDQASLCEQTHKSILTTEQSVDFNKSNKQPSTPSFIIDYVLEKTRRGLALLKTNRS